MDMSLKEFLAKNAKKSRILSNAWYTYRRYHNAVSMWKFRKQPVEQNTILFNNFYGRGFACNPRVIAQVIHKEVPTAVLRWICVTKEDADTLPDYIEPVYFGSNEYFKAMATSSVWVFNELLQDGIRKRKDQFYIQTYHGERGFKKVGYDAVDNDSYRRKTGKRRIIEGDNCDLFLAGSQYAVKFIRSAFEYNGEILTEGTPRDDCLIYPDLKRRRKVREVLSVSDSTKVLLYAPTFRDSTGVEGEIGSDIDLNGMLKALSDKSGEPWICLLRAHGGKTLQAKKAYSEDNRFKDVTRYPDMADLLLAADFLITDYSSCSGDFALTGKPILLYQDDIDSYTNNDRSMYFKMEDSPYWTAHNMEEAIRIITEMTDESAIENDRDILRFYETTETGKAAEAVCQRILAFWSGRSER